MAFLSNGQIDTLVARVRTAVTNLYDTTPLSKIQTESLKDPGVKENVWVAKSHFPAAIDEDKDVRQLIASAVTLLGRGDEEFKSPQPSIVIAEWVGHRQRNEAIQGNGQSVISEQAKYTNLMQDVKSNTTIVYVFGGAFFRNCPATVRSVVSKLVETTGARCLTVGYRLAPQNPFPAALLDVLIAYLSLLYPPDGSWHSPVTASSIVFAGDSSGSALILAMIQIILSARHSQNNDFPIVQFHGRPVKMPMPAGVTLVSLSADQVTSPLPSWYTNAAVDLYSREGSPVTSDTHPACEIWPSHPPRAHVYCEKSMICHPLVSVAAARSWKGSPPFWVAMGEERLLDAAKSVVQTAAKQGVTIQWEQYERMPHNWPFVFPQFWQSEKCLGQWARAIMAFAGGKKLANVGEVNDIQGQTREVNVNTLLEFTVDEVEKCMRENTEHLETWTGGLKIRERL